MSTKVKIKLEGKEAKDFLRKSGKKFQHASGCKGDK